MYLKAAGSDPHDRAILVIRQAAKKGSPLLIACDEAVGSVAIGGEPTAASAEEERRERATGARCCHISRVCSSSSTRGTSSECSATGKKKEKRNRSTHTARHLS